MASGTLAPTPRFQLLDNNGLPLNGGLLYTYFAGTTTPATTYSDQALTVPNANPIVLNSSGRPSSGAAEVGIFLPASSFKFVLKTSAGVTVWTQDSIQAVAPFNVNLDVTGTAGEALTAGQFVYNSDGSGGKTAGRWYLARADLTYASSLAVAVGVVPSDIASAASGSIRLSGLASIAGLVAGSTYYISATPGAITTTAPTNSRRVGIADTAATLVLAIDQAGASTVVDNRVQDFRLTLTTAVPVTTADVTAATTVFISPYAGNRIALYDGVSAWSILSSAELSIALGADTASLPYDVFAYNNSGVVAVERLAWTSDTVRATALALQDGVLVKSGTTTRRYLGTYRTTTVVGQTEDSAAKRYVWNYYNRVVRPLRVLEATASWNYTVLTWRQARATATNQVDIVVGWAEDAIDIDVIVTFANSNALVQVAVGIGEDSTSAVSANALVNAAVAAVANAVTLSTAHLRTIPAVGRHFYAWLEESVATGTTTWYSAAGLSVANQSGMSALWRS